MVDSNENIKSPSGVVCINLDHPLNHQSRFEINHRCYRTHNNVNVHDYPNADRPTGIFRGSTGAIYYRGKVIGFDVENDGKIKMPTVLQKSFVRKVTPLDIKWRNGNLDPMSCDEYWLQCKITKWKSENN